MHFSRARSRMIKFPHSHPTAAIVLRDQRAYIAETWGLRVLNIQI
jgi:hypothetical protein